MCSTCSPCRTIDRTFILSFSLPNIEEISQEYEITEERKLQIYRNPLKIALKMEKIITKGNITRAELARRVGISDVRVTQYMNLLKLDSRIKKKVLEEGEKNKISERELRRLMNKK